MKLVIILFSFIYMATAAIAQAKEGVLVRCGASTGHAFFFKDELFNPTGRDWIEDAISNGKIILVKLGEEWDIQFDDISGAKGYREDGAKVIPLTSNTEMLMIGAFHSNYSDIYTFNFEQKIVAWSSNKLGPFAPKVASYTAICE